MNMTNSTSNNVSVIAVGLGTVGVIFFMLSIALIAHIVMSIRKKYDGRNNVKKCEEHV